MKIIINKEKLMEDFFIIPNNKIETAWNPPDKSLELYLLEYCEEVLDVPLFVISDASWSEEGLEIDLYNLEDYMLAEDWYTNLSRLSNYALAS